MLCPISSLAHWHAHIYTHSHALSLSLTPLACPSTISVTRDGVTSGKGCTKSPKGSRRWYERADLRVR
eukprot:3935729-Rhodomonas_salina.1